MKKRILIAAALFSILCAAVISYFCFFRSKTVRIACVGDSITWGAYLKNRSRECYPSRLQQYLGNSYTVKNFGVNSATVQKDGDKPYWNQKAFQNSTSFSPDIVFLMLGTNDTKTQNWKDLSRFRQDYAALVDHYLSLPSQPEVYILTPPPVFSLENDGEIRFSMHREILAQEITAIKDIAAKKGCTVIDINEALSGQSQYFTLDGVHPDSKGAQVIAETVYRVLQN
ncbi:MAG: GDSL-type esterase/lipase family protein [Ruminococcus sp.]|jgi:acyl-CoA thioesterase-1